MVMDAMNKVPPHPTSASLGRPLPEGRGDDLRRRQSLLPVGEKVAAKRSDEGASFLP
jgi:hypothetical protein